MGNVDSNLRNISNVEWISKSSSDLFAHKGDRSKEREREE
jgi:hypothetical protein